MRLIFVFLLAIPTFFIFGCAKKDIIIDDGGHVLVSKYEWGRGDSIHALRISLSEVRQKIRVTEDTSEVEIVIPRLPVIKDKPIKLLATITNVSNSKIVIPVHKDMLRVHSQIMAGNSSTGYGGYIRGKFGQYDWMNLLVKLDPDSSCAVELEISHLNLWYGIYAWPAGQYCFRVEYINEIATVSQQVLPVGHQYSNEVCFNIP
jgi:hypothetical protein